LVRLVKVSADGPPRCGHPIDGVTNPSGTLLIPLTPTLCSRLVAQDFHGRPPNLINNCSPHNSTCTLVLASYVRWWTSFVWRPWPNVARNFNLCSERESLPLACGGSGGYQSPTKRHGVQTSAICLDPRSAVLHHHGANSAFMCWVARTCGNGWYSLSAAPATQCPYARPHRAGPTQQPLCIATDTTAAAAQSMRRSSPCGEPRPPSFRGDRKASFFTRFNPERRSRVPGCSFLATENARVRTIFSQLRPAVPLASTRCPKLDFR